MTCTPRARLTLSVTPTHPLIRLRLRALERASIYSETVFKIFYGSWPFASVAAIPTYLTLLVVVLLKEVLLVYYNTISDSLGYEIAVK